VRFTTRAVFTLILLLAVGLAWRSSLERADSQLAQQTSQLRYAQYELARARDQIKDQKRSFSDKARLFFGTDFEGMQLAEVTITSQSNAFQRASLKDCDLTKATLQGGVAAFQLAAFDRAKLSGAKLTGGGASFQNAAFVDADLTGAVLTGGANSFRSASFENAILTKARLTGSFESANVSGAHFEGADLSALDGHALASCYFSEAPTYDAETKFPAGFDPVVQRWRRSQ